MHDAVKLPERDAGTRHPDVPRGKEGGSAHEVLGGVLRFPEVRGVLRGSRTWRLWRRGYQGFSADVVLLLGKPRGDYVHPPW